MNTNQNSRTIVVAIIGALLLCAGVTMIATNTPSASATQRFSASDWPNLLSVLNGATVATKTKGRETLWAIGFADLIALRQASGHGGWQAVAPS